MDRATNQFYKPGVGLLICDYSESSSGFLIYELDGKWYLHA